MTDHRPGRRLDSLRRLAADLPEAERRALLESIVTESRSIEPATLLESLADEPTRTASPAGGSPCERLPFERIDEFRVLGRLGAGAMGEVFLAEDTTLERYVALKTIAAHRSLSPRTIKKFRDEAIAVAKLRHPSIVRVHRVSTEGEIAYLVMDYIPGDTLRELIVELRRDHPISLPPDLLKRQALLLARVCEALHHVHNQRIVHRDVKPTNVLLDIDGQPFLTDFGVAKTLDDSTLTATGQLTGTVPYMSPEQASGRSTIDRRSDLFSMGVMLYECIALERPFDGATMTDTLRQVIEARPRPVRDINPAIPKDLATICHMALEREPEHRYQTAAHLAGDLRCFVEGRPITGRPPSWWRRAREWGRTHRVQAMAAGLAVLTLLASALAMLEVRRQHSLTARLVIDGPVSGSTLTYRRADASTLEWGPTIEAGVVPFDRRVPPGHYRFTSTGPGGAFSELSVLALRGGVTLERQMPRPLEDDPSESMVLIPGGTCSFGRPGSSDRFALREIEIEPVWIDRTEVSNADYRRFIDATGRRAPSSWPLPGFDAVALADRPVVGIGWDDAQAYASWVGKRLPTMFEWECAMRSPDGQRLPWGDASPALPLVTLEDEARVNAAKPTWSLEEYTRHTVAVGDHDEWATPLGLMHGATNVREFTDSVIIGASSQVVIKGAAWTDVPKYFNLSDSRTMPLIAQSDGPKFVYPRSFRVGFRCARSARQ